MSCEGCGEMIGEENCEGNFEVSCEWSGQGHFVVKVEVDHSWGWLRDLEVAK